MNNKGLTLIELMIVLTLSMLLMAAVYMTFQLQHKSSRFEFQIAATQQDLRAAMEVMSTDIQNAGYDPTLNHTSQGISPKTPDGTLGTVGSGTTQLRVRMDLNGDAVIADTTGEDITYRLNGTDLERYDRFAGTTTVLISNVTSTGFTYYDDQASQIVPNDGTALGVDQVDKVRYVEVYVTVQSNGKDPDGKPYPPRTLDRRICRRNGFPL
jgi:type IV pilus assembly protein PilW